MSRAIVPHKAYVEDAPEEEAYDAHSTIVEQPMPSAPSPPPAVPEFEKPQDPVNVFDFLVDADTPNGSRLELAAPEAPRTIEDAPTENRDRGLVRVRFERAGESLTDLVEYGSGPVYSDKYRTPAPKSERDREQRRERKNREHSRDGKSDKKRKRLHVDTQDLSSRGDHVMTDAPPILHSGLTGGLKGLLSRPSVFPPSPDYSGGDFDASPGSPLKKTKHSKRDRERGRGRVDTISNNIMSLITSTPSREHSEDRPRRKKHHRRREESERPARKMIEYQPMDGDVIPEDSGNQMVLFRPRAELLLDFVNKGPDSERGVSMNKALKRYHRERYASGTSLPRAEEEKELWRSLRMKRNERGEIVLFL
jgi:cell growth-regulating nucleolar protein